ncbi:hypothetical protein [Nocardioides litoris]|uniref:hypothetical protein n=1 Tax=Nocardioides litoris TaxID=1926648 RepID=UPI00111CCBDF|nr:hypothetical protein [Nocardioides litoris]
MSEVIEHPAPTDATNKELYAHAFTCARPDCAEWLYRQEPGVADRVLNSRVCHIHARRSNGPRWLEGMTSEANRSVANLLILCIPHSYEIDEHADRFPAELLQEWRASQLAEYERSRQGWVLTDEQAREVARESFESPTIAAPILAALVRCAERLCVRAEATRPAVTAEAMRWRATWQAVRASLSGWDEDGNTVYAEPSRQETDRHKAALLEALVAAREAVVPLAEELKGDIAAARHSQPRSAPWCDWLVRATDELLTAVASWPGPPPAEDDSRLTEACSEVRSAARSLAASLRGEAPSAPPPLDELDSAVDGSAEDDPAAMLDQHLELLDRARPWHRVKHLAYDAELRTDLAEAAVQASVVPRVLSMSTFGLDTTAALAASVARNAPDEVLADLIETDRQARPLVVMSALLVEMWRMLTDRGLEDLAQRARESLVEELTGQDWSDDAAWAGNEVCGAEMFTAWAALGSGEDAHEALLAALSAKPELVREVVVSCSGWTERHSTRDGSMSFHRSYRTLPEWFPADAVVEACAETMPTVTAAGDSYDAGPEEGEDEVEYLVSRLLRVMSETETG